jgi:hypothetical protein
VRLEHAAVINFRGFSHDPSFCGTDNGVRSPGGAADPARKAVLQGDGRGMPAGRVRHADVAFLLQDYGSASSGFSADLDDFRSRAIAAADLY